MPRQLLSLRPPLVCVLSHYLNFWSSRGVESSSVLGVAETPTDRATPKPELAGQFPLITFQLQSHSSLHLFHTREADSGLLGWKEKLLQVVKDKASKGWRQKRPINRWKEGESIKYNFSILWRKKTGLRALFLLLPLFSDLLLSTLSQSSTLPLYQSPSLSFIDLHLRKSVDDDDK